MSPLVNGSDVKDCISKNFTIEKKAGKPTAQARAIALSHCNKIYGGIKNKKNSDIMNEIILEITDIEKIRNELYALEIALKYEKGVKNNAEC